MAEDGAYMTKGTRNLIGLSLEFSFHHNELGLSVQMEESNVLGDELRLSLNLSNKQIVTEMPSVYYEFSTSNENFAFTPVHRSHSTWTGSCQICSDFVFTGLKH